MDLQQFGQSFNSFAVEGVVIGTPIEFIDDKEGKERRHLLFNNGVDVAIHERAVWCNSKNGVNDDSRNDGRLYLARFNHRQFIVGREVISIFNNAGFEPATFGQLLSFAVGQRDLIRQRCLQVLCYQLHRDCSGRGNCYIVSLHYDYGGGKLVVRSLPAKLENEAGGRSSYFQYWDIPIPLYNTAFLVAS